MDIPIDNCRALMSTQDIIAMPLRTCLARKYTWILCAGDTVCIAGEHGIHSFGHNQINGLLRLVAVQFLYAFQVKFAYAQTD